MSTEKNQTGNNSETLITAEEFRKFIESNSKGNGFTPCATLYSSQKQAKKQKQGER